MKYTAFWMTLAAACAFSAGNAFAQGAGQGHHEVGSGSGNPSVEAPSNGGIGGNTTSGQGHYGPNGSGGAAVPSNIHNGSAGQGHFEAGGSGGGNNGAVGTPNAIAPAPRAAANQAPSKNPSNLTAPKEMRNDNSKNARQREMGRMNDRNMNGANDWRFVYSNGMWWYYQPDNSWTYYQNGSWANYNEPRMARMDHDHANMQDHANANHNNSADNNKNANNNNKNATPENSKSNNNRVEKH